MCGRGWWLLSGQFRVTGRAITPQRCQTQLAGRLVGSVPRSCMSPPFPQKRNHSCLAQPVESDADVQFVPRRCDRFVLSPTGSTGLPTCPCVRSLSGLSFSSVALSCSMSGMQVFSRAGQAVCSRIPPNGGQLYIYIYRRKNGGAFFVSICNSSLTHIQPGVQHTTQTTQTHRLPV